MRSGRALASGRYCNQLKYILLCRRRKRQVDSYRSYLRRVLTSVHPDLGISAKAMEILNSMTHDMYERITTEAARLLRITGTP